MCCPNCGDSSYKCGCFPPIIIKEQNMWIRASDLRKLVEEYKCVLNGDGANLLHDLEDLLEEQ